MCSIAASIGAYSSAARVAGSSAGGSGCTAPQQRLYFLPLPHEHGWLRPTLARLRIGRRPPYYARESSSSVSDIPGSQ
jgi:hypothetical protein